MKFIVFLLSLLVIMGSATAQNSWTQKASSGLARQGAVSFTIGDYTYVCLGRNGTNYDTPKALQSYNPSTDTWATLTYDAFPGTYGRAFSFAFVINDTAYVGGGFNDYLNTFFNDFWKFDISQPPGSRWTQLDNLPTHPSDAVAFTSYGKGYYGTGFDNAFANPTNSFYAYTPGSGWAQQIDFGGALRSDAVAFTINDVAYVGTGNLQLTPFGPSGDFWKLDPAGSANWSQIGSLYGTAAVRRWQAVAFAIGGKGYVTTGNNNPNYLTDVQELDPATGTWTQVLTTMPSPNVPRILAVGFSGNGYGFISDGSDGPILDNTFAYSPFIKPVLSSPANNTTCLEIPVALSWESSGTGASYTVWVSTVSSFSNYQSYTVTTNSKTLYSSDISDDIVYYWKVKSDYGNTDWTDFRSFRTKTKTPSALIPTDYGPTIHSPSSLSITWEDLHSIFYPDNFVYYYYVTKNGLYYQSGTPLTNVNSFPLTTPIRAGNYVWTITAINQTTGCSSDIGTYHFTVAIPIIQNGVDDVSDENSVILYPNPVNEQLTISLNGIDLYHSIEIYNSIGNLIESRLINDQGGNTSQIFNTTVYPQGVYFAVITTNVGTITRKFTIVR